MTTPILLTILTRGGEDATEELRNTVANRIRAFEFQLVIGERVDDSVAIFGMQSHAIK